MAKSYWLIKSEPSAYSWEQLLADKSTSWTGVRNFAARNHLRAMKKGDLALFYHSNVGKEIVGVAKVTRESYQDPTTNEDAWVAVDVVPESSFKNPVGLDVLKKDSLLKKMKFVTIPRLSVSPVTEEEFRKVLQLAK